MNDYILSMLCVSGDLVQVSIYRYEDIFYWLKLLDHGGSSWTVTRHLYNTDDLTNPTVIVETVDITDEVMAAYQS